MKIEIKLAPGETFSIARANVPNANDLTASLSRSGEGLVGASKATVQSYQEPDEVAEALVRRVWGMADNA